MRRLSGQAARASCACCTGPPGLSWPSWSWRCVGVGRCSAGGWRRAPLDLPWLTHRIEAAVNTEDKTTHLSIGWAALAWEGFSQGVDRPLDLRLHAV